MKFYAILCVLIAAALVLTPTIAMVHPDHEKNAAVTDLHEQQTSETATEWATEKISAEDE